MMSPDKGSPFNSRWEQGLPQTWKKKQYDMRLILGKFLLKWLYNICICYIYCCSHVGRLMRREEW